MVDYYQDIRNYKNLKKSKITPKQAKNTVKRALFSLKTAFLLKCVGFDQLRDIYALFQGGYLALYFTK
jgi:hypothetical protein